MRIQFVNNLADQPIVGYVGNYPSVTKPASTGPIKPGGGVGDVDVPPSSWTVTIQLASDPPLGPNSPQENVQARTGGISGNAIVILDAFGGLSVSRNG